MSNPNSKVTGRFALVLVVIILVVIDLTRNNHHPDKEHSTDDPETEDGLPALTYESLAQFQLKHPISGFTTYRYSDSATRRARHEKVFSAPCY